MQLDLSDDQSLFLETTVRFIETELPITQTRALHDDPIGYDRSWLQKSAELGWFAMLVPETDGGGSVSGEGLRDAAIVAETLGRYVQPGPFVPMNVVADAIARNGSDAQRAGLLPGIVGGELIATWAFADNAGNWDNGAGLAIERVDGGLRLAGVRGCCAGRAIGRPVSRGGATRGSARPGDRAERRDGSHGAGVGRA